MRSKTEKKFLEVLLPYRIHPPSRFFDTPPEEGKDSRKKFVKDFVKAWHKVMNLDRFDLHQNNKST